MVRWQQTGPPAGMAWAESCWTERPGVQGPGGLVMAAMPRGNCSQWPPLSFPRGDCHSPKSSDAFPPDSWTVQPHSEMPTCLAGRKGGACTPRLRLPCCGCPWHSTLASALSTPQCHRHGAIFARSLGPCQSTLAAESSALLLVRPGSMHPVPVTLHTAEGLERGRHIPGQ